MQRSTATRRLVKSPPELWAQLSSQDALARHLAEFGEIRITRVDPETTVAWEGDRASGTVELEATGWGTKVSLTATAAPTSTSEAPAVAPPSVAEEHAPTPATGAGIPPGVAKEKPPPAVAVPAEASPSAEAAAAAEFPKRPRGFFARLFRRRRAAPPASPAPTSAIPGPPVPLPDPRPPAPGPQPGPPAPPAPDPSPPSPMPAPPAPQIRAHAVAPVAFDADRTVEILTEVLDELGAAHHRPFSRD